MNGSIGARRRCLRPARRGNAHFVREFWDGKGIGLAGYRQALAVAAGTLTEAAGIEAAQQGHRNFAKRQLTWFRREPEVRWLEGFGDDPQIVEAALAMVRESLEAAALKPSIKE